MHELLKFMSCVKLARETIDIRHSIFKIWISSSWLEIRHSTFESRAGSRLYIRHSDFVLLFSLYFESHSTFKLSSIFFIFWISSRLEIRHSTSRFFLDFFLNKFLISSWLEIWHSSFRFCYIYIYYARYLIHFIQRRWRPALYIVC